MALLDALAGAIAPGCPVEDGDGPAAIEDDSHRLAALLAAAGGEACRTRLWTNRRCLVTTRRFAARPNFPNAVRDSAARGWPVYVRPSGGTTVVHRPGMLNVSRYEVWRGEGDAVARFGRFCADLAGSLRAIGIAAELGWIAGSHCDGRFNLSAGGRKIGGTASLMRRRGDNIGLLSHATIWIEGDVAADVRAVERFERAVGGEVRYSVRAHATLQDWDSAPRESMRRIG